MEEGGGRREEGGGRMGEEKGGGKREEGLGWEGGREGGTREGGREEEMPGNGRGYGAPSVYGRQLLREVVFVFFCFCFFYFVYFCFFFPFFCPPLVSIFRPVFMLFHFQCFGFCHSANNFFSELFLLLCLSFCHRKLIACFLLYLSSNPSLSILPT